MSETNTFYHALKVDPKQCSGCTICIFKCPTHAIRIKEGKATIHSNWCIDCGECFMSCPAHAIYVEQDDFNKIFDYTYRVALVPALFLGQFSKRIALSEINNALYSIGFTHIYPVEISVDSVQQEINRHLEQNGTRPLISSYCPATNRLIQIKYPDLTEHIIPVKSPANATATLVHHQLCSSGVAAADIGLFYVTPCAAKIAEIKGMRPSETPITGVINMDTLYNKVQHILSQHCSTVEHAYQESVPPLSKCQMCWSLTGGEAKQFAGRTLAIDEIHNVIEFIERMESTNDVQNVDFLELRACDGSCVGGALTPANRFLASERVESRAQHTPTIASKHTYFSEEAWHILHQHIEDQPLEPMVKLNYKGGITAVLKQMEQVRHMMCYLPGIDCGACGAPGCQVLAQDIVRGEAQLSSCMFLQRDLEHKNRLPGDRAYALIEKIWGKNRMEKNCYKRGATHEGKTRGKRLSTNSKEELTDNIIQ